MTADYRRASSEQTRSGMVRATGHFRERPEMSSAQKQRLSDEELRTLEGILAKLSGSSAELPPTLFRFVTEIVATSNVDLLVQDEDRRILLAWRDDAFGTGWHVPGSIIRHREEVAHRIRACAREEFGCDLVVADGPVALIQIFDDRGHSVSLCYTAALRGAPRQRIVEEGDTPQPGSLRWFDGVPSPLYPSHLVYRSVIEALRKGRLGAGIEVFTQHVGRRDAAQASPAGTISADESLTKLAPDT